MVLVGLSAMHRLAIGRYDVIGNFYAAYLHEKFANNAVCTFSLYIHNII